MKSKQLIILLFGLLLTPTALAQVGIGTVNPDQSSILELESNNKGFLPPRLANNTDVANPAEGLIIYNESTNCIEVNIGTPASPEWTCLNATSGSGGNSNSGGFGTFPWKTTLRFTEAEFINPHSYYGITADKNLFMGGHMESTSSIHEFNGDNTPKQYDLKSPKFMDFAGFNGKVEKVETFQGSYAVLTTDKKVYMWGYQGGNQIGNGHTTTGGLFSTSNYITTPLEVPLPAGETEFTDIFKPNPQRIFLLGGSGKVYFRGAYNIGVGPLENVESGQFAFPSGVPANFKYTRIVGGSTHAIYLEGSNGKYYAAAFILDTHYRAMGANGVPYTTYTSFATASNYHKDPRQSVNIYEMEFPAGSGAITKMEGINGQGIYMALGADGRAYAWGRIGYSSEYIVSSSSLPNTPPSTIVYQNTPLLLDFPPGETSFKDICGDGAIFRTYYLGGSGKIYMIKRNNTAPAEFYVLESEVYGTSPYREVPMPSPMQSMDTRSDNGLMGLSEDGEVFYLGNKISGYPNKVKYIGNANGVQPYAHIPTPLMHGQYDENNPNHVE